MKLTFTQAFESLQNLKNRKDNKVCFLFSSCHNRVKEVADFFESHSNCSIKRFDLSELIKIIAPNGKSVVEEKVNVVIGKLKRNRPEYIILEDKGDLTDNCFILNEICTILGVVGKNIPIIVASEKAAEISILYGEALMLNINGLNDNSLKIKSSKLATEELYFRNQCEAIQTGVFWSNRDFFSNYLENKMEGDKLFAMEKYQAAFESYNKAISFHGQFDEYECPMNDFLGVVLYIRCIACFFYGKWPEHTNANNFMKETVDELLLKVKKSSMGEMHGKMLKDYDMNFMGVRDGWLERRNYLLFLNEYAF